MSPLKIVFAGTPDFAAQHLRALLDSEHEIIAVYTQPDRPSGRGKKLSASPVKALASENGLPVIQPVSLKSETAQAELAAFNCDIMVVVAYGLLLPKAVLDTPRLGCINVHGSILPRWRGAAPIQRAIEAGDETSGVTIMQMDVGLDTGDMLLKSECAIGPRDTSASLHDRLCDIGPPALIETLQKLADGTAVAEKQNDELSAYARKIEKAEALIDWQQSAQCIDRKIRAFNPFPICFTHLNDQRLRVHAAKIVSSEDKTGDVGSLSVEQSTLLVQCGTGTIALETLQLPGKKPLTASAFINGFSSILPQPGERLRLGDL